MVPFFLLIIVVFSLPLHVSIASLPGNLSFYLDLFLLSPCRSPNPPPSLRAPTHPQEVVLRRDNVLERRLGLRRAQRKRGARDGRNDGRHALHIAFVRLLRLLEAVGPAEGNMPQRRGKHCHQQHPVRIIILQLRGYDSVEEVDSKKECERA